MPRLTLHASIPAPVSLVYAVVADVEKYPEFLPAVAEVARRGHLVSMTLRLGLMPITLLTRAEFTPPEAIDLTQVEGPFRRFKARWNFRPVGDERTDVAYHAEYEWPMLGGLLSAPADYLIQQQTEQQIRAFETRVQTLWRDGHRAEGSGRES